MDATMPEDHLLFADSHKMAAARTQIHSQSNQVDPRLLKAYKRLIKIADNSLKQPLVSVMDKERTPPSGDKHDFMSQGPYWWPDPTKSDGLPYIQRDGERNPEIRLITDAVYFNSKMSFCVDMLAKAYYFSANQAYASKAAEFLRTWFLDKDTRMNPNMEFAQAIPGRSSGRCMVTDLRRLGLVLDAIYLIQPSSLWTKEDEAGMQAWCKAYLEWLLKSKNGKEAGNRSNNHGTFYDLQTVPLALYIGQTESAKEMVELCKTRRLDEQLAEDGSQPRELARTRSWHYSSWNLGGLFKLAQVAAHAGVDLYGYKTPKGADLKRALDFLLQFALEEKKWPYKEIKGLSPEELLPALDLAERAYPDGGYAKAAQLIRERCPDDKGFWLLW